MEILIILAGFWLFGAAIVTAILVVSCLVGEMQGRAEMTRIGFKVTRLWVIAGIPFYTFNWGWQSLIMWPTFLEGVSDPGQIVSVVRASFKNKVLLKYLSP